MHDVHGIFGGVDLLLHMWAYIWLENKCGGNCLTVRSGGRHGRNTSTKGLDRAMELSRHIRVAKQQPAPIMAALLNHLFSPQARQSTLAWRVPSACWMAILLAGGVHQAHSKRAGGLRRGLQPAVAWIAFAHTVPIA